MPVKIGSARSDENGRIYNGKAGDQTGREVSTQAWYLHSKGWRVFRSKNPGVAEKIARCMEMACSNERIGYDQYERNSLYRAAKPYGFDVSKVTTPCETDCSALVRVCCAYAAVELTDFNTADEAATLLRSGAFVELTGAKYQSESMYLGRGDILVTRTKGHTVIVLSNGKKYEGPLQPKENSLGDRVLRHGCEGTDVRLLQELLLKHGYDLGAWGCDGDFGDCTELAVRAFQRDHRLTVDGECGPLTLEALLAEQEKTSGTRVRISGGDCYIRTAPNCEGKVIGVAHRGEVWPFAGEVSDGGWLMVEWHGSTGWVSGKYGRIE